MGGKADRLGVYTVLAVYLAVLVFGPQLYAQVRVHRDRQRCDRLAEASGLGVTFWYRIHKPRGTFLVSVDTICSPNGPRVKAAPGSMV